ncbi:sugar transferase [Streptococcus pyogenes]|uniref:sugar transferase n=1 Tax=Streptococcus pyogenes TaxID=1314 RepID=UPI003DA04D72
MYRSNDEYIETGGHEGRAPLVEPLAHSRVSLAIKRLMDIIGALTFFTVFLPLYLAVALGVRLSSRGPIFYVQDRMGLHGRTFRFYKFRSMVENSDEVFSSFLEDDEEARSQWERYQKLDRDPRITRFGQFIRRTSLDELPQFWNVLLGDMSLVGPRPCMPSQKNLYGAHWKAYCAVRPGLTGLWQVSGRNRLTYDQRVALDAEYIRGWSIHLDLVILLRTVTVVVSGAGSR